MPLSRRVCALTASATAELAGTVADMQRRGIEVLALNVGEPDFPTPENVARAAHAAIVAGLTKYTPVAGTADLRRAIAEKLHRDNGLVYAPEDVVSSGAKQAVANAILAICDAGDEVVVPTPCWVSYVELVRLANAQPILVPLDPRQGYALDPDGVRRAVTPRTKAIILNTPNNPTGAVYTEAALRAVAELAIERGLYLIADEVYEKLIYDDARHVSIAALAPEVRARTVTVNGLSKAFAMTGWRLGYAAGPPDVVRGMTTLQGHITTNANSIAQAAAIEALSGSQEHVEAMRQQYAVRRRLVVDGLRAIPGMACHEPQGAFYVLPQVASFFGRGGVDNARDLSRYLLEQAHVAVVPGDAFLAPGTLRLSYATATPVLERALQALALALQALR